MVNPVNRDMKRIKFTGSGVLYCITVFLEVSSFLIWYVALGLTQFFTDSCVEQIIHSKMFNLRMNIHVNMNSDL